MTISAALKSARRYSNLAIAKDAACAQTYFVPVLMGDDGKFWVPSTNRQAGMLMRAGYEGCTMTKQEAIEYFGSVTALAKALETDTQTISMWKEYPPMGRQYEIQVRTKNKLRATPRAEQVAKAE